MRIIGVLDPLIWDRELLKKIFGFDYTWEVYKKEKDRIWGYYVFPLLYLGKLIGRIEIKLVQEDENKKILKIFNLILEKHTKVTEELKESFYLLLDRLTLFTKADQISKDRTIKF